MQFLRYNEQWKIIHFLQNNNKTFIRPFNNVFANNGASVLLLSRRDSLSMKYDISLKLDKAQVIKTNGWKGNIIQNLCLFTNVSPQLLVDCMDIRNYESNAGLVGRWQFNFLSIRYNTKAYTVIIDMFNIFQ